MDKFVDLVGGMFKCLKGNNGFFSPKEAEQFDTAARISTAVALNAQTELLQKLVQQNRGRGNFRSNYRPGYRGGREQYRGNYSSYNKSDFFDDSVKNSTDSK